MFSTSIKGVTPNSFQSLDINDKQRDYDYCVSILAFIYFFYNLQYDPMSESDSDLHTMRDYLQNLAKAKQKHLETVQRKRK